MIKVIHVSISSAFGGGPEHIFQLIQGLPKQFESHVACPDDGPYFTKFKELVSNRITIIPYRKFSLKYLLSLFRYVKNNRIDILHAHGKGAGVYCKIISAFMKIHFIYTPHGINQKIEQGFGNELYIRFERALKFLTNAIIFVSETESTYAKRLNVWNGVKSFIILNGTKIFTTDTIMQIRSNKRKELDWTYKKVIITSSRFDYQKNTIEFCTIASLLPDVLFAILGDGIDLTDCRHFCESNEITNVLFLGVVPDPSHYFAAADLYLSTARWEGLSMAILEGMAVGLPTVATNVIGNIDIVIAGETGYLYNLGDIYTAVKYIKDILDIENYSNFSTRARLLHEKTFSSFAMGLNTANVYKEVLNQRKLKRTN